MKNVEKVLAFVRTNPNCTQADISERLDVAPRQQVYSILQTLFKRGQIQRVLVANLWRYRASQTEAPPVPQPEGLHTLSETTAKRMTSELHPGDSAEQRSAEAWLIHALSRELSVQFNVAVQLERKRLYIEGSSYLELDGFCSEPLVLCEAWAHVGPPKSAQKNKVMTDALKLLYAASLLKASAHQVLLLGDYDAASHFQGGSWMAQCLHKYGVRVHVAEFPPELRESVQKAQGRQYR